MTKEWKDMTEAEIRRIKERDCTYCDYYSITYGIKSGTRYGTCDYIGVTGKRRGCHPGECREAGAFKQRTDRRRQQSIPLHYRPPISGSER